MSVVGGRKVRTKDNGIELVACSFGPGIAEDGSWPVLSVTGDAGFDGYMALGDGYGMAVTAVNGIAGGAIKGVIREGVGSYQVIFRDTFRALMSWSVSVQRMPSEDTTVISAFLAHPGLDTLENNRLVQVVRLRIVNSSGVALDLVKGDRISLTMVMKNSSV